MDKMDKLVEAIEELAAARALYDEASSGGFESRNLDAARYDLKRALEEVLS